MIAGLAREFVPADRKHRRLSSLSSAPLFPEDRTPVRAFGAESLFQMAEALVTGSHTSRQTPSNVPSSRPPDCNVSKLLSA